MLLITHDQVGNARLLFENDDNWRELLRYYRSLRAYDGPEDFFEPNNDQNDDEGVVR